MAIGGAYRVEVMGPKDVDYREWSTFCYPTMAEAVARRCLRDRMVTDPAIRARVIDPAGVVIWAGSASELRRVDAGRCCPEGGWR